MSLFWQSALIARSSFAFSLIALPEMPQILSFDRISMILSKDTSGTEATIGKGEIAMDSFKQVSRTKMISPIYSSISALFLVMLLASVTQATILSLPNFWETSAVISMLLGLE